MELTGSNASSHAIGQGNSVTRTFIIPWSERLALAESLLGDSHPSIPWCWCRSVKLDPFPNQAKAAGGDGEIVYDLCQCTAEYGTDFGAAAWWPSEIPRPACRLGTTLQLEVEASSEFLRVPARETRWEDNTDGEPGKAVPGQDSGAGRLLVALADYTLTWDYLADVPINGLRGLIGSVNGTAFLGCYPETLLFLGFSLNASTRASITSPACWQVVLKYSHRHIGVGGNVYGWNHEYRADGWKRVLMKPDDTNRYPVAAFAGMFA